MDGGLGALHAGAGELVLLQAGELVLGGAILTKGAHGAATLVGVFQAVEHHVVNNAVMPDAVAAARLGQQVGGVAHALHAAGHQNIGAAGQQHVVRQHGCAHARAAHLAQRDCSCAVRQAALEGRLAGWCLALAGHQAIAHQHLVHPLGRHASAMHRSGDGCAAQVVRRQRRKIALKTAHGGAGCTQDKDRFRHQISFLIFAGGALASACQPWDSGQKLLSQPVGQIKALVSVIGEHIEHMASQDAFLVRLPESRIEQISMVLHENRAHRRVAK